MAASREGAYEVVREHVLVRCEPSLKGRVLTALPGHTIVRGVPLKVGGEPWLRVSQPAQLPNVAEKVNPGDSAWILIDATPPPLRLGPLLKRVAEDVGEAAGDVAEVPAGTIAVRCLSGALMEVTADCLWDEHDLRAAVGAAAGIPWGEVRVLRGTEELRGEALRNVLWDGTGGIELTLVRDSEPVRCPPLEDIWSTKIKKDWRSLKDAPQEVRADPTVVLTAVAQDWSALLHADEGMLKDHRVALAAVEADWRAFEHVDKHLQADPRLVLAAVKQNCTALQWAPPEAFNDRSVILATVRQQPELLAKASERLRSDPAVVLAAVKRQGGALRFAAPELRAEWQVVHAAVQQDGCALKHACEELRSDRHIVLTAARENPGALDHANPELLETRDLALAAAAVQQCPDVLRDLSDELYSLYKERTVVLAAVNHDGRLLRFAHPTVCANREVVLAAVCRNGDALRYAATSLQGDFEVVLRAVQEDWRALEHASDELREDRSIVLAAVGQSLEAITLVPERAAKRFWKDQELWGDPDVVLDFVSQDGKLLRFAGPGVQGEREVVLAAVKQNWEAFMHVVPELRQDREVALAAAAQGPEAFALLPEKLRANKKVVLAAVRAHGRSLEFVTPWLRRNREVVLQAVRRDASALQFASAQLQADGEVVAAAAPPAEEGPTTAAEQDPAKPDSPETAQKARLDMSGRSEAGAKGDAQTESEGDKLKQGRTAQRTLWTMEAEEPIHRVGSTAMVDPEGEEGLYTGLLDASGRADGHGELLYGDGEQFVGEFVAGAMQRGVLYSVKTNRPRDTMAAGQWTPQIDQGVVSEFPIHRAARQVTCKAVEEATRRAAEEKRAAAQEDASRRKEERALRRHRAAKETLVKAFGAWRLASTERPMLDAFGGWKRLSEETTALWKQTAAWKISFELPRVKSQFYEARASTAATPKVQHAKAAPHGTVPQRRLGSWRLSGC